MSKPLTSYTGLPRRERRERSSVTDEAEEGTIPRTDDSSSHSLGSLESSINGDAGDAFIREDHIQQNLTVQ